MLTGQLTCRIHVYYGAMAYVDPKPADMLNNFDFINTDEPTAHIMGGWAGATFATVSCLFMAAAQLPWASQKKLLQYHGAGMFASIYMTQQGKELIKDTAPLNKNFGLALCTFFLFLSLYPCYYGPDAKSKSD